MSDLIAIPTVEQINAEHRLATRKAGEAVHHAANCGMMLLQIKDSKQHGEWLPWLNSEIEAGRLEVKARQARSYMQLAANWQRDANLVEAPSIRAALEIITKEPVQVKKGNDYILPWRRADRAYPKLNKETLAKTLRAWPDLRFSAATYMDAEGLSIKDMATELNQYVHEIDIFFNPIIPKVTADKNLMDEIDYYANRAILFIKRRACRDALGWCYSSEQPEIESKLYEKQVFYDNEIHKKPTVDIDYNSKSVVDIGFMLGWKLGFIVVGQAGFGSLCVNQFNELLKELTIPDAQKATLR